MSRLVMAICALAAVAAGPALAASRPADAAPACASPAQKLNEAGFVAIGGIEQWVTIRGDSCANPVVLVLHGGPANTLSPYARAIYGPWEASFTIVQWDQRGAGMTYGRSPPVEGEMLSVEQMADDGVAVAKYAAARLGQRKVILMGGSWSSILGVHMVKARPSLFHAYVGSANMVSYLDNQAATYGEVLARARAAGDLETIARLQALGPPPWTDPRSFGVLRRAVRKYEAMATDPPPANWWVPEPAYATPRARADYQAGEDYSFLQFVGRKGDGMFSRVDLYRLGPRFEAPVFFVQGAEDLLTTPAIARRYFDGLRAPRKAFVLVPRAGHDPNQAMLDAQFKVLKERVVPLIGAAR